MKYWDPDFTIKDSLDEIFKGYRVSDPSRIVEGLYRPMQEQGIMESSTPIGPFLRYSWTILPIAAFSLAVQWLSQEIYELSSINLVFSSARRASLRGPQQQLFKHLTSALSSLFHIAPQWCKSAPLSINNCTREAEMTTKKNGGDPLLSALIGSTRGQGEFLSHPYVSS